MTSRDRIESKKGIILSGGHCVVCGWDKKSPKGESLVEGAHIRPFKGTSDYDKSDNIVGLCPNHHREYDAGSFTIDPLNNRAIYANQEDPGNLKKIVGRIAHVKNGYFDYHRKKIFGLKK